MTQNYIFDFKDRDYVNELKQHINLSESAWLVINEDIKNFYQVEEDQTRSGFLNRIFRNFYQQAESSISLRLIEKASELENLYSSNEFKSLDKNTIKLFIDKYLVVYEANLIKKSQSYEKGECEKFRINKENLDIIRESSEGGYYLKSGKSNLGLYLKAIFEEYATKPTYIREQIFFADTLNKINLAITNQCKLKLLPIVRLNVKETKKVQKKFYVSPYKVVQDSTRTFNYLIGYAEEIISKENVDENGNVTKTTEVTEKSPTCFRISRINKIDCQRSMGAHLSKEKINELDKMLIDRGPQFMTSEPIDIKVRFTDKGIEAFKRQLYMRPNFYTVDENDKNIYTFHCTEVQAINYFFKIGWDACIIEPAYLHNKMKQRYERSLMTYNGMTKQEILEEEKKLRENKDE